MSLCLASTSLHGTAWTGSQPRLWRPQASALMSLTSQVAVCLMGVSISLTQSSQFPPLVSPGMEVRSASLGLFRTSSCCLLTAPRAASAAKGVLDTADILYEPNTGSWLLVERSRLGACCDCIGQTISNFVSAGSNCSQPFRTCMHDQISDRLTDSALRLLDTSISTASFNETHMQFLWRPEPVLIATAVAKTSSLAFKEPSLGYSLAVWNATPSHLALCNSMISFENQESLIDGYDFGLVTITILNAGKVSDVPCLVVRCISVSIVLNS